MTDVNHLRNEVDANSIEAARAFPLMGNDDLRGLADDIRANGLREAIWRDAQGLIVDGRNRWVACQMVGVECHSHEYKGEDVVAFVVSHNLRRRHLDEGQRAMIAGKLANLSRGQRRSSVNLPISSPPLTQTKAAEMLNVSTKTVGDARAVLASQNEDLIASVDEGSVSVSKAAKTARAARTPAPRKPRAPNVPSAVVPEGVMMVCRWVSYAQMLTGMYPDVSVLADQCAACGKPLDAESIEGIQNFVAELAAATKAGRAA